MSVCWKQLRRVTEVGLTILATISLGCRADAREEARGDIVIERLSDPLRVVEIDVGRAIGPDNRVIEPVDEFRTNDTIYASIVMRGSADAATLIARWKQASGEVVDETVRTVTPVGETIAEFHLVQPSGWARGAYTVEIVLDGATVGRQDFEVS
jgi:hypothetical protein